MYVQVLAILYLPLAVIALADALSDVQMIGTRRMSAYHACACIRCILSCSCAWHARARRAADAGDDPAAPPPGLHPDRILSACAHGVRCR